MNPDIKAYYDQIATCYDADRFGNSYGRFIDAQEHAFLAHIFQNNEYRQVLDVGCGTGRFLEYATHGLDVSAAMLAVARLKHPEKNLVQADAFATPFEDETFDAALSMHMVMHLEATDLERLLTEMHRILKTNGCFVFDFPSKQRRTLLGYQARNWHGANTFDLSAVKALGLQHWQLHCTRGILFLPLHRFPPFFRPLLWSLDTLLCRSFLKKYASYLVVSLFKK